MSRSFDQTLETERTPECGERHSDGVATLEKNKPFVGRSGVESNGSIRADIDWAAAGNPTMSQFLERLNQRGITPIPSIQQSGRLNGMSYRKATQTVKGSEIGRAYTAQGLEQRLGVNYQPERDLPALRRAVAVVQVPRQMESLNNVDRLASRVRDRRTGLSPDQKGALTDVGRFRMVAANDLITHRYRGEARRFEQDIRVLTERGFTQRRTIRHSKSGMEVSAVVLTPRGRRFLESSTVAASAVDGKPDQRYYAGLVKPQEARHDLALYRMYQAEAGKIEEAGGRITRVVLDYELKGRVFSQLNRPTNSQVAAERKLEAARENGLSVVSGRLVFPDVRIEYETRDGQQEKVDLELVTGDYKASQLKAKAAAGLKMYSPDGHLGGTPRGEELIAELISL